MKKLIYALSLSLCLSGALFSNVAQVSAEELNEDELFAGADKIESQDKIVNDQVAKELNEKHIGFSGRVQTNSSYNDYKVDLPGRGNFSNALTADFDLDIRLTNGVKSFMNFGVGYVPEGVERINVIEVYNPTTKLFDLQTQKIKEYTILGIREFFVDANYQNQIYLRTGKQFLKWGRGYFWNPTDMINIGQKNFLDMDQTREGTYGARVHVPWGVKQNLYLFLGANGAENIEDLAVSGKYEFLLGNTEMSCSTFAQQGRKPVYGYDISTKLLGIDLRGEVSATEEGSDHLSPKACVGFTKSFDLSDVQDRIMLTGEFYYNEAGYDHNIFNDGTIEQIGIINYQPFQMNKYYAAFFSSFSKFIISDLTLSLNGMMNLVDKSMVVTTGLSYKPTITNLGIDLNLINYLGDEQSEATAKGSRYTIGLGTSIAF